MTRSARDRCFLHPVSGPRVLPLLFALAALFFAGCGSKHLPMAPVKGKVLLDGQPLTFGGVGTIPPMGRGAHGDIQSDGTFVLSTYEKNDGALIGKHKVSVAAYQPTGKKGPEAGYGKLMTPKVYGNPETSGLAIDVQPGGRDDVVLELSSKEKKK